MAVRFKGAHFLPEVMLMGVHWYVAYPLSFRHVEERAVHAHWHRADADDQETTALEHLPALFLGIFLGGLLLYS